MESATDQAMTRESLYGVMEEPTYGGIVSFMRRRYSRDLSQADVAVLGVPFDWATTNRPGSRFGPRAVREASASLAWEWVVRVQWRVTELKCLHQPEGVATQRTTENTYFQTHEVT